MLPELEIVERIQKRRNAKFKAVLQNFRKQQGERIAKLNLQHEARLREQRESHKAEIARVEKTVQAISEKAASINWDRCVSRDGYQFTMVLNSEMFAGYGGRDEALQLLAKVTGQRVECEIRSSRFVKAARDREYERFSRKYEYNPFERYHEPISIKDPIIR